MKFVWLIIYRDYTLAAKKNYVLFPRETIAAVVEDENYATQYVQELNGDECKNREDGEYIIRKFAIAQENHMVNAIRNQVLHNERDWEMLDEQNGVEVTEGTNA